jgi:hypothetical protein
MATINYTQFCTKLAFWQWEITPFSSMAKFLFIWPIPSISRKQPLQTEMWDFFQRWSSSHTHGLSRPFLHAACNSHGLQQLHVLLVPAAPFHLVVQLQDDLIFKLKEMKVNEKDVRRTRVDISLCVVL